MSRIANKSTIYAIVRNTKAVHTICGFTKTLEGAENLCDVFMQRWVDKVGEDDTYFYPVANTFYDQ